MKLFLLVSLMLPSFVMAYPKFVGHGYNNCMVCHYNSQGNGPLTDYGRALGASEIAGKLFRPGKTDEEVGKSSNFLWQDKPLPLGIRPSINYRGLLQNGDFRSGSREDADFINMQMSANVAVKINNEDQFVLVGELSYNPKEDQDKDFRSREYYLRFMPNKNTVLYGGLMDKVYGIRFENHYLYSRSFLRLSHSDQSHGLIAAYQNDFLEITGQYFLGNLHIDGETEQTGFSSKFIYKPNAFSRYGFSALLSDSKFRDLMMASFHGEIGFGHGGSLTFEFGQKWDTTLVGDTQKLFSRYFSFQGTIRPMRGLYVYQTFEYFKQDNDSESYVMRLGPGVQWFIDQGLELRFDFLNARSLNAPSGDQFNDQWEFLSQVHVWL